MATPVPELNIIKPSIETVFVHIQSKSCSTEVSSLDAHTIPQF